MDTREGSTMSDVISIIRGSETINYESAVDAFANVQTGDEIKLLEDVTLSAAINIDKVLTLDLNGHALTSASDKCVFQVIVDGKLTVKDTSELQEGSIIHTKQSAIYLSNTSDMTKRPVFTLESGTIQAQEFGICTFGGGVINVAGGTVIAKDNGAIGSNGSAKYAEYPYEINISGGNIFANTETAGYANCGVYHANAGKLNISGGNIVATAGAGVVVRAGEFNITGGHIEGQGDTVGMKMGDANPTYCGGIEICNAANYPGKMGKYVVSGGTIVSAHNYGVVVIGDPSDPSYPNASASQGVISGGKVVGELGALGFITKSGEDIEEVTEAKLTVVGGDFNSDVEKFVDPSVNLSKEYDSEGNVHYVIKDGLKAVISYLDEILDNSEAHDAESLEMLKQVLANIETVIEKAESSIESIDGVSAKVDTSNETLSGIQSNLDDTKAQLAQVLEELDDEIAKLGEIKDAAVSMQETSEEIKNSNEAISSTSESILGSSEAIQAKTAEMDDKLTNIIAINEQIASLQKKTVEEIAKIYGDDPEDIIGDDDKPHKEVDAEILSIEALIANAKKTGQTTAIWQHLMTEKVRSWLDSHHYTCFANTTAKVGDQWIITIPE